MAARNNIRKFGPIALAPLLAAGFAASALAQEPPAAVENANREGIISYTPVDFAAARPNTALDMINRLPGFTLFTGEQQVRGFAGAAGNILIDSQRPTIKTETLQDLLGRIPIAQVERIELIRGGAPGIDMQGQTVVANVIRKKVDTFQQVLTVTAIGLSETGKVMPGWNYQATRQWGEHQVDVQLSRQISYDDSQGFGERFTFDAPSGVRTIEDVQNEADGFVHSARASYKGPLLGGTFNANGLISTDEFKNESRYAAPTTLEFFANRSANDRGEIGLNYTRPLTSQLELEALVLGKLAVGSGDSTGAVLNGSSQFFGVDAEAGESIGRSVLRYSHSPTLSFEGGGEVAFNYREQQIALEVNNAAQSLPASDTRVEELRGEVFVQGSWRPKPELSLEAGVRIERSTITQSGDTSLERSFNYPKPRVLATWSPTKNDQLRVRIEREVGQLNFRDFTSNVSLSSNVLTAGNADLRPDKTWVYEAAFERRFWENGALVLTVRHEEIQDVVDVFPFQVFTDANGDGLPDDTNRDGQPDSFLVAGPGNIGDGKNDVIDIGVTLPLARLGIEGAELKINAKYENSEVTDPLTGQKRRISSQRPDDVRIQFRHDLPALKLTYGLGWYAGWEEQRYLLQEVQSLELRGFFNSYIEYKPTPNFTLRTEINNFDPYQLDIERIQYSGPRGTGALREIELERRQSQVIGQIRARWQF